MREPTGEPMRVWFEEVPNDGIIRYLDFLNSERLLVTNPKTLAEMLVQKTYDFVKPPQLVSGLGKILGVGVFLAEGEEHKVSLCFYNTQTIPAHSLLRAEAKEKPHARVRL